jgi:DNA-binding NtrC family response regulator
VTPALLVIDDDPQILIVFRRLAQDMPLRLVTASTYQEGLSALSTDGLRMIIADYRLPDGDGLSLLEKAQGACPGARLVLFTGEVVEWASFDKHVSVLGKPCTLEALREVLLLVVEDAVQPLQRTMG